MILVAGATGTNGRELVARLTAAGEKVRALVRGAEGIAELAKQHVDAVQGDLDQPATLDAAFQGITKAFVVTAVDPRSVQRFRNFFDAARRANVNHVVKFSGMGAGANRSEIMRQHGESDDILKESGLNYTILQPNSFFQNMLWSVATIKDHGAFYLPMKSAKQSLVDVRDIAEAAAVVLTQPAHTGKTYEITGAEALSYADIAATLTAVLGRKINYVNVPLAAAKESMIASGMPEWNASAVTELYDVFGSGDYARTSDAFQTITGHAPRTFEQFVRDHAAAFRG